MRFPTFINNWKKSRLDEYSLIVDGTHQTPNYQKQGIKFVSVENIKDPYSSDKFISKIDYQKYKIKPQLGDILMTRITAGIIGDTYVIDKKEDIAYYVSLALIRSNQCLNPKYLAYYINSYYFKHELDKRIIKVAFPRKINLNDIGECMISFTNLDEQEKIAQFLELIDQRIQTQIKIISSIESQIKSINNHAAFDSVTNESSIGSLFDIKTNSKMLEKHDGKYCIVDMGSIDSNGNYITGKYTDDITSLLTKGTLVMPKDDIGGGKIICKTLYINESNKYVLSDHVFALKLRNIKYNPMYFSSLINSQYHNHNLKRLVTGSAQLGINQKNLNKYKLRFSDCLELQKKYSKLIQPINKKLLIEKKLLNNLYNQKNYLMKNVFVIYIFLK